MVGLKYRVKYFEKYRANYPEKSTILWGGIYILYLRRANLVNWILLDFVDLRHLYVFFSLSEVLTFWRDLFFLELFFDKTYFRWKVMLFLKSYVIWKVDMKFILWTCFYYLKSQVFWKITFFEKYFLFIKNVLLF